MTKYLSFMALWLYHSTVILSCMLLLYYSSFPDVIKLVLTSVFVGWFATVRIIRMLDAEATTAITGSRQISVHFPTLLGGSLPTEAGALDLSGLDLPKKAARPTGGTRLTVRFECGHLPPVGSHQTDPFESQDTTGQCPGHASQGPDNVPGHGHSSGHVRGHVPSSSGDDREAPRKPLPWNRW